jgi:hypothetical protein
MLLVYLRSFVDCTLSFMHSYDSWHVALEEFCIWGGAFLRSCAAFLPSMFSGGALVFRAERMSFLCSFLLSCIRLVWACEFYALFLVVSSRCPYLWGPRSIQVDLALMMSLMQVTLIFYIIWPLFTWYEFYLLFDHLDESFSFYLSNHFLCFNVVNTLIKGEIQETKLIWALIW